MRKQLTPTPQGENHHLPVVCHGLRLGGADSHPNHFSLSCKSPQCTLGGQDEAKQITLLAKSRDAIQEHTGNMFLVKDKNTDKALSLFVQWPDSM